MASGRKVTFGLIAAAVVAVIGLIVLAGNSPRADYPAMRAFLVSRLNDEDLRRFDAEARAKYAAEYAAALEQHRASLRQKSEDRARCDDVAFRTRSPAACTMSFGEMMPFDTIISSVAMRVEMQIMGVCGLGPFTVREARRLGCLP
jgi:hypothetical protein